MIKREVTYTNFDNEEVTETLYFNLTKAELVEMEMSVDGGLSKQLTRIGEAANGREVIEMFKLILGAAYGERSPDGKKFRKSEELFKEFATTEAYSTFFMEIATDAEKAGIFIAALIPKDLAVEMETHAKKGEVEPKRAAPKNAAEELSTMAEPFSRNPNGPRHSNTAAWHSERTAKPSDEEIREYLKRTTMAEPSDADVQAYLKRTTGQ